VAQPVVDQTELLVAHRGRNTAAAVVTAHDDVTDLQHVDRKLNDRQAVQVAVHDHVRDVAMNEDFPGQQAEDLIGRHAAVGAPDPQVPRRLLSRQPGEEIGIGARHELGPGAIALQQDIEGRVVGSHRRPCATRRTL
jgi:hypothetical protein